MSPLVFLAIPLVIFAVGSSVLYLGARHYSGGGGARRPPAELRSIVPMVQQQRETAAWRVGTGTHPHSRTYPRP